jgi:hypothetical protein
MTSPASGARDATTDRGGAVKPYRLGAPNHRGEWSVIDPNRKLGEQVIGYAILPLVDTHITGIQPGEAYEVGDAEIVTT